MSHRPSHSANHENKTHCLRQNDRLRVMFGSWLEYKNHKNISRWCNNKTFQSSHSSKILKDSLSGADGIWQFISITRNKFDGMPTMPFLHDNMHERKNVITVNSKLTFATSFCPLFSLYKLALLCDMTAQLTESQCSSDRQCWELRCFVVCCLADYDDARE